RPNVRGYEGRLAGPGGRSDPHDAPSQRAVESAKKTHPPVNIGTARSGNLGRRIRWLRLPSSFLHSRRAWHVSIDAKIRLVRPDSTDCYLGDAVAASSIR